MKQLTINPNNRQYYSEDFIKGFECGTQRQLEADKADIPTWIPCSERLPKQERATYLICTDGGYVCSCRWTDDAYGLGATKWNKWGWSFADVPQHSNVLAWMDLKPWKGIDDE